MSPFEITTTLLLSIAVLILLAIALRKRPTEPKEVEGDEASAQPPRAKWKRDLAIAVIVIAGASAAAAYKMGKFDHLLDKTDGAIAACEGAVQSVLASPASYRRRWVEFGTTDRLTIEQYNEYHEEQGCTPAQLYAGRCEKNLGQKIMDTYAVDALPKAGIADPSQATRKQLREAERRAVQTRYDAYMSLPPERAKSAHVTLEYDADNGFGASQRSFVLCQFGPLYYGGKYRERDLMLFGPIPDEVGEEGKRISEQVLQ